MIWSLIDSHASHIVVSCRVGELRKHVQYVRQQGGVLNDECLTHLHTPGLLRKICAKVEGCGR
jgi:hypothetical protein